MKTIKNLTAEELRKSILQLAIQGKLVKQNPDDEPASELVKRIYEEKNKLVAEGKIKKDKNQSYIFKGDDNCYYEQIGKNIIKLDDIPFEIPDSWTWIRFGNLVNIQTGASFKKEQAITESRKNYVRVLRGGNILPFEYLLKNDDLYIPENLVDNKILLHENDLITPAVTSLENIGKVAVIDKTYNNVTAGGFVYIFRPYFFNSISSKIIMNFMSSSLFQSLMKSITKKSGQAFYNMNKDRLQDLYFPLPPINEQHRIINKINSFIPLLDIYKTNEQKLSDLEKSFPDKLKKSILQFAIEGKLVRQNPDDEPAIALLERIKNEKEQLIREGKIKKEKTDNLLIQDDYKNYYENLPSKWELIPLQSICQVYGGKRIPAGEKFSSSRTNYKYLRVTDMKNSSIVSCAYISKEIYNLIKKYTITKDDIYITVAGTIGVVGEIPSEFDGANLTENADKLVLSKYINKNWFIKFLQSNFSQKQIKESITKVGQPKLAIKRIENIIVCLPPYNEQIRITNFINKILMIID